MDISLSVVSHGQASLVRHLLDDLQRLCAGRGLRFEVVLTMNIPESLPFDPSAYSFPVRCVSNEAPKGFGANHNSAFEGVAGQYFCVVNPDIRLLEDPFPMLLRLMTGRIGVLAPLVVNPEGAIENSARKFPTPWRILRKLIGRQDPADYTIGKACVQPDWVGGMFMLFPATVYRRMLGFDTRYFLYYEDVDVCARLWLAGYEVTLCPLVRVVHAARRSSHRSLRYALWHVSSMARFFLSRPFRSVMWLRWLRGSSRA